MTAFLVRRLALAAFLILAVDAMTFLMVSIVPADPARLILGIHATASAVAELRHTMGLDQPLWTQYGLFLWHGLHGNLGFSYAQEEPVGGLIAAAWPRTAILAILAVAAELAIGVPIGLMLTSRRHPALASVLENVTLVLMSVPLFWVGLILLYVFAFKLGWFPLAGGGILGYVLPAVSVGLTGSATYARLLMATLAEVREADHVRTARAKGVGETAVLLRHIARVGLLPFVTQLGADLGNLMGGLVVLESVFSIVGVGNLAYTAISQSDIPVIESVTLVTTAAIIVLNVVVDLVYAFLDPRVVYN
jgi:peptide/nickel transport system permease protein